jgi:hypothetical protein
MSQVEDEAFPDPLVFDLSEEEARIGAARARFRGALRQRFSLRHVAPLVAFLLLMLFTSTLALTGLLSRRHAEEIIILSAIAFMMNRLWSHWRLRKAQSDAGDVSGAIRAGSTKLWLDGSGLSLRTTSGLRRFDYRACRDAENTGGLVYLWSDRDEPAIIPVRAFANEQLADQFLGILRERLTRRAGKSG